MVDETKIVISASDQTKAAFDGVLRNFESIKASAASMQTVLAGSVVAFAALAAVKIVDAGKQFADLGDSLYKMSQRSGVSVEALSTLRYAADLSGVSLEDLDGLLIKLNKTLGQAGAGDAKAATFLKQFGIEAKDVASGALGTEEALKRIADRFANSPDGINKATAALELFGKSGAKTIAFLNQGREGIEGMQSEAQKLGLEMSTNTAKAAEQLNDNLRTLGFASEGLKNAFATGLIGPIAGIVQAMRDATIEGGKFQGFIAGLQTLLTGTDQYKNDVKLVELTEKKFALEQTIAAAQASNNQTRAATFTKELKSVEAQLVTTLAYRKELDLVARAEEAAAKAREKAKKDGEQIQVKKKENEPDRPDPLKSVKTYVDGVRELLVGLTDGEFERMRAKADDVFKRIEKSKLNGAEIAEVPVLFAKVIEDIRAIEEKSINTGWGKALAESFKISGDAAEKADDQLRAYNEAQSQFQQDMEFELSLVGKLAYQSQKLTLARRIDLDARRAIAAIPEGADNRDERIADINTLAENAKQRTGELFDAIRAKSRDTFVGGASAAKEYFDRVTDGASNARMLFETAFQGMEDAMVKFITTGKADFKSLLDSILADIVRIQVRQGITGPLAKALGKALGGDDEPEQLSGPTDGGGGIFDGFKKLFGFASGGRPPLGVPSMVGERGPELFVPDVAGTIVPNSALGGGGVTIVQYNSVDGRTDRASILLMMAQAKDAAKAEIMDSMNRGGAFAR